MLNLSYKLFLANIYTARQFNKTYKLPWAPKRKKPIQIALMLNTKDICHIDVIFYVPTRYDVDEITDLGFVSDKHKLQEEIDRCKYIYIKYIKTFMFDVFKENIEYFLGPEMSLYIYEKKEESIPLLSLYSMPFDYLETLIPEQFILNFIGMYIQPLCSIVDDLYYVNDILGAILYTYSMSHRDNNNSINTITYKHINIKYFQDLLIKISYPCIDETYAYTIKYLCPEDMKYIGHEACEYLANIHIHKTEHKLSYDP